MSEAKGRDEGTWRAVLTSRLDHDSIDESRLPSHRIVPNQGWETNSLSNGTTGFCQ